MVIWTNFNMTPVGKLMVPTHSLIWMQIDCVGEICSKFIIHLFQWKVSWFLIVLSNLINLFISLIHLSQGPPSYGPRKYFDRPTSLITNDYSKHERRDYIFLLWCIELNLKTITANTRSIYLNDFLAKPLHYWIHIPRTQIRSEYQKSLYTCSPGALGIK